ncbi:MAG TPA: hypothetical protein VHY08_29425 [Bacillota bacterium]|nr:hypothetical protein [Bacillota bacterium]
MILLKYFKHVIRFFTKSHDTDHGFGSWRLGEYNASAYHAWAGQTLTGIPSGTYTLSAWVRSSGTPVSRYMYIKNYGGNQLQVNFPVTNTYTQITITGVNITTGTCEIGFEHNANAGNWLAVDDVTLTRN